MKLPRRQFLAAGRGCRRATSAFAYCQCRNFPTRPVRLVVGFAGGSRRYFARLMGQSLSERFGQQFIVENRPGGGAISPLRPSCARLRTAIRCLLSARTI